MTQKVYLVCGVPGSGKTWVCEQLKDKFSYLAHDMYFENFESEILKLAQRSNTPVITECPFAERKVRDRLTSWGLEVIPIFVIEAPELTKSRFEARESKPFSKGNYSRTMSIATRAEEWGAVSGTSTQILSYLKELTI